MSAVLAPVPRSAIVGGRILLQGPGGTGKTSAIRTLIEAGVTPFVLSLDAAGLSVIGDIPDDKLHWHVVKFTGRSWKDMIADAQRQSTMDYDLMAKTKDPNKSSQQTRFVDVLSTLAGFKCDRCEKPFGEVDGWGTGRALVIDHFTELCQASKEWTVGNKLIMHQGEWGAAQNMVENLIRQLMAVTRCWIVVIAHIERELDEVRGGTRITTSALGRKLAPKLPPMFGDVVSAEREGKVFKWSTATPDTDLKTRILPIDANLVPSFKLAVELWKAKGGVLE